MKKRLYLFILLLLAAISPVNVYAAETAVAAGKIPIQIKMDPRVELMSLIFRLAGRQEYHRGRVQFYNKDIDSYFAPFKDHGVVQKARELWKNHGVSFDAVMNMAIHVTDAYTLQERVPFAPRPPELDRRWPIIAAREFLYQARDFVKQTKFQSFIRQHQPLYHTTVSRLEQILKEGHLDWLTHFFAASTAASFIIVPGLLNNGHSYGVRIQLNDGTTEFYCILGVGQQDREGFPYFDRNALPTVIHEFCHSYINPLVDRYASRLKTAAQTIYPYVAGAMRQQHYGDWKIMLYESLVRACVVRYILASQGPEASQKQIATEINNQFLWIEKLSRLLGEYETQRDKYPNLETFFPRLTAFFSEYARELEKTPRVVSMIPANGATDVNPNLQLLIFNFSRPMRDQSWSLVGGGPKFPQLNGAPYYHSGGTILSVPVKLKPGWEYEFWLNSGKYLGFTSAEGVPLAPVHIRFKTRNR